MHVGPRFVPFPGRPSFNHKGGGGPYRFLPEGVDAVNAVLCCRRLEGVLTVGRVQGQQCDARAMAVGHPNQFRIDLCARRAPGGGDLFHQHGPTARARGQRDLEWTVRCNGSSCRRMKDTEEQAQANERRYPAPWRTLHLASLRFSLNPVRFDCLLSSSWEEKGS